MDTLEGPLWRLVDPVDDRYARCGRLGTWEWTGDAREICPECTSGRQSRVPPLVLVWEPGSDRVGDFSWPGAPGDVAVTGRVIEALEEHAGFRPDAVVFEEERPAPKRLPQVSLPYAGPPLFDFWITASVPIDRSLSTATLLNRCGACGEETWDMCGIEHIDNAYDLTARRLIRQSVPRVPGEGLFVRAGDLGGADFFRLNEAPAFLCCTDRVKAVIAARGFTNCGFRRLGDVV